MDRAGTEQLMDDLRAVVAEAEALFGATAGHSGTGAREARDRVAGTLEQARARLERLDRKLHARVRETADDADRYVREHPWQSVGVAAAVGVVVGLLIGRR